MKKFCIFAVLVWPIASHGQPYSQSMAQCAGLTHLLSEWVNDPERSYMAEYAAGVWANAAVIQAEQEGVSDAATYVRNFSDATYAEWEAKGQITVFSEDFKDWTAYCRKFGDHMGLTLLPDA